MSVLAKARHYVKKVLLTFLGPADLDEDSDPVRKMDAEYRQKYGTDDALPEGTADRAPDARPDSRTQDSQD